MFRNIGFIGTGVMGKSMIRNLLKAGKKVHVYTRTKEKANDLLDEGAIWENTVADLAKKADLIITIVGFPQDVEEVYLSDDGILKNAKPDTFVIDMTTSNPLLAKKIYEHSKKRNIHCLDAPVSGGDVGARNGTLSIMVGGDQRDYELSLPILRLMGKNIIRQGEAGAGQHTKMANQIAIASTMIGVTEAIVYAKSAGLDPTRVLDSISTGAAGSWSLTNLAPRMIAQDYSPGFFIKHFIKDMKIALQSAKEMGLDMPGLELSLRLYTELAKKGEEDSGTQALIKWFNHS